MIEPEYKNLGQRLSCDILRPHTMQVAEQRAVVASLIGRIENVLMKDLIKDDAQATRLRELVNETCRAFDMAPLSEGLKRVLERGK